LRAFLFAGVNLVALSVELPWGGQDQPCRPQRQN
jgi:hypothetical protein